MPVAVGALKKVTDEVAVSLYQFAQRGHKEHLFNGKAAQNFTPSAKMTNGAKCI